MWKAEVIEHSRHPLLTSKDEDKELITIELCYPRFIHSELMTHRVFSRNASSSRATPIQKTIEQVKEYPAMPIHWGANQKGMQASTELSHEDIQKAKGHWLIVRDFAVTQAEHLMNIGAHKQVVNRILEPFQFIKVVVTSSYWDNWFELRDHPDAQPEIKYLAELMKDAISKSTPNKLTEDNPWHLPYVTEEERVTFKLPLLTQVSTARCCRVSYYKFGSDEYSNLVNDMKLYDKLITSKPIHASPTEHQARYGFGGGELGGNLGPNWQQHRKFIEMGWDIE